MGNVALLLLTVLLLQLGVACAWGMGIWAMQLPRRPAWHWLVSGLLCAATMALVLLRDAMPGPWGIPISNLAMLGTALALARGMRLFLGLPLADREALVVVALLCLCALLAMPHQQQPAGVRLQAGGTTLALLWVLARATVAGYQALCAEFDRRRALALVAPMGLTLLMAALRLVSMVVAPARPIHVDAPLHVAVALLLLVAMLMLHGSMAAMVVMRLVGQLRELSQRDALTGLLNRVEWLRQLRAQHRWLSRHGEGYAVLMIDIDHFKQVNDRWGHPAGDAVLVNVAQVLTGSSRALDVLSRLGGEEFAVLLPRTDAAAAERLAERLRAELAASSTRWREQALQITVSIGVALAQDADEAPAQLIERADAALYRAKHGGRNRVVVDGLATLAAQPAEAAPSSPAPVRPPAVPLPVKMPVAKPADPPPGTLPGPRARRPDFADTV
ncbi:GGDEF domain-containing protein [Aquabacterium sp. OR-4]|uniref:GGDEF domain-containing protein n=1 Tax=Aquabacterium sp. OR-4 TaxID=2978127 RepID=UPI0021B43700|nr:GGDEF domain-containing protein [Aquabacterium sp. OR-4]MDT7835817.1 GGDEF domain-containing protein [Aquabacterium sp. OR-4]